MAAGGLPVAASPEAGRPGPGPGAGPDGVVDAEQAGEQQQGGGPLREVHAIQSLSWAYSV
jgi:hypothetical protein